MRREFDLESIGKGLVYLKPISVRDLPESLQDQAGEMDEVVSVHSHTGEQIALVASELLARDLAREHDMQAVTVQ